MKRILAILLTLATTLTIFTTTAFAEENSETGIPENATRHTIELTLQPQEEFNVGDQNGAAPYVWGDPSLSMADNHVAYTHAFYLSDRYFAFEMQGFLDNAPSGAYDAYTVELEFDGGGTISSLTGHADYSLYKKDWITINTDSNYRFKVTNHTDYILTVYFTYYSWN